LGIVLVVEEQMFEHIVLVMHMKPGMGFLHMKLVMVLAMVMELVELELVVRLNVDFAQLLDSF
jgi:hypothetical protein